MKISRIKIISFRQHRNVDIDLSSEQSDFVVIKGTMGAGKTNLLRAITWAIFGDLDGNLEESGRLLSDSTFHSMSIDDYRDVEVHIEVAMREDEVAFIRRKQTFKRTGDSLVAYSEPELIVQIMRDVQTGFEVESDPKVWIERHFPRRFRPYFLFDGERLESFRKDSDAPKIKSAIQEVARIDVLNRIQEKLISASTNLIQKAARLSGVNGNKLANDLGEVEKKIVNKEVEVRDLEGQHQLAEEAEKALDKKLSGDKDLEANITKKKQIDASIETEKRRLKEAKFEFNLKMVSVAPAVLLAPALKSFGEKVEEARKEKVLPPPIDLEFLRQLVKSGTCICGVDLSSGSGHSAHLSKLISDYEQVGEIGSALNEHAIVYLTELSKLPQQAELIALMNKGILEREEEIERLEEQQEVLTVELEGQDNETVRNLAKARREQREIALRALRSIETTKVELKDLRSAKLVIEKKIATASAENEEADKARNKAEFAKVASEKARELYVKMNDQVREAVSNSLASKFLTMTWKKDYYGSVSINSDFKVSVLKKNGVEDSHRMSAGETACLAFAFSLTLSKEAGLNFPIIVDTPMGRLAPDVQVNLAEVLVEATRGDRSSSNHQMILLMTETEYNTKVAASLSKRRPKVLEISFDQNTSETQVR